MQESKVSRLAGQPLSSRLIWIAFILVVLLGIGLYVNNVFKALRPAPVPERTVISQSLLEENYGLRVSLVAVTAAGGLIDVRLKMLDGEKANALIQDPGNFPSLWIADGGISLAVPTETSSQGIKFDEDGNLFLMFPNSRSAVKPGTPVSIRFGDIQLEPIPAR